jgi:hypothetical protein
MKTVSGAAASLTFRATTCGYLAQMILDDASALVRFGVGVVLDPDLAKRRARIDAQHNPDPCGTIARFLLRWPETLDQQGLECLVYHVLEAMETPDLERLIVRYQGRLLPFYPGRETLDYDADSSYKIADRVGRLVKVAGLVPLLEPCYGVAVHWVCEDGSVLRGWFGDILSADPADSSLTSAATEQFLAQNAPRGGAA